MAARPDGFSIREYTSRMRSIDVFKCWPFTSNINRELTREELQSWLPPMTLRCPRSEPQNHHSQPNEPSRNYLEASRTDDDSSGEESLKSDNDSFAAAPPDASASAAADDDEKLEMVCPVCREFNAATLTAVNAHIDGCLAQTMREERRHMRMMNLKSNKSRPPKKRSIAEIFKEVEVDEEEEPKVLKLWPLREEEDDDAINEVSVTVRKFQWLSRRLEALRSSRQVGESAKSGDAAEEEKELEEEKLEMVCPVCRDFNAATVTAVNAHIDSCLAQAVRDEQRHMKRSFPKPKPKVPKKRSIAEILTAAPPIDEARNSKSKSKSKAVEEDEDEEKSSDCNVGDCSTASTAVVPVTKSKASTNKNSKTKMVKKANKKKKKRKLDQKHGDSVVLSVNNEKKKQKKNAFNNDLTGKKEVAYKRMVQTVVRSSRKLRGSNDNKMVALHDIDPSVHRKKLCLNGLSVRKKQEFRNCDSVGKQQKAVFPVGGIPKDHSKLVSGKTSSGCNSFQDGTEDSDYSDQMPTYDRQVKFSGKADILGPKKRDSFDETMFNISSDALATSSVKQQSSVSDEENVSLGANRNYHHIVINTDREKRKDVCPIVESKQFANTMEQVTAQNFLKPCTNEEKSKPSEEKSELLTKMAVNDIKDSLHFEGGNTTTLHFSPYADISRPLAEVQEDKMSGINTQVCESGSFSSSAKFIDHPEDPTYQVDAVNKNGDTKTFLEHSSPYSVSYNKVNENPESSLQTCGDTDNSGHALGDRQLPHIFPGNMIDNTFPFTCWGKGRDRSSSSNPNFFGLPLNSHGELINFSSSVKVGMEQPEKSSTLRSSLSGLPIDNILHQNMQENLSINPRHAVQKTFPKDGPNPFTHYSARSAVNQLQCSEREVIHRPKSNVFSSHNVQPLNSELLKQSSFRVQSHTGNGMVSLREGSDHISPSSSQPTVRLMGKDVPIGRSSQEMQQFARDVWTDEESRRHYSQYALENSLLGRCPKQDWVSGSSTQISTDNGLQSVKFQSNQGLMNGGNSEFSQQFIDLQSNHVSRNGSLGISRNSSSYFNPITQESTSYAVFNGAPEDFPERCIPGTKPPGMNDQSPVLPTHCNFSQPTCSSNGELNNRNKNPPATKSAFGFPFLQPSVNDQSKTPWFQRPYGNLPSWLSSSAGEMLPGTFSQQFSGTRSQGFPQNQWGNNFIMPSVNHSAEVYYPSDPLTSRSPMKAAPLSPASIVHHPLRASVTPSTTSSGCRNVNKVPDRVRLDDMITEDRHHPCINTRKRPAVYLDDSRKHVNLSSNMEIKESLTRMTRLSGENSSVELQRSTMAVELDSQVDSARSRCCQNLNPTSYPAFDSYKMDGGTVTSGPLRLGPKRAKLILRSS